ncbi:fluoride efflux transporter CrcB [Devosia sp. RR2S18]|uniref:fluoride efflux transporter CrcB n=1 Tax=Devosia rhizosphaerae TaxID=3049774 RepID=UPI00253FA108|nr:fluoride efflux transporter CrcB [Devosia sp. RR2S18]WIJ26824.1 fluoride efflux transporter CrcB [Devosia sp. RR2S18]
MQAFLLVGAGGALGAMARYGTSVLITRWWQGGFPLATIVVNVLGSLLMGVLIGILARLTPTWAPEARLFVAVGVLGGFTTFSTFSLDAITLLERGAVGQAATYMLISVVVCLAGLYLGLLLTRGMV